MFPHIIELLETFTLQAVLESVIAIAVVPSV